MEEKVAAPTRKDGVLRPTTAWRARNAVIVFILLPLGKNLFRPKPALHYTQSPTGYRTLGKTSTDPHLCSVSIGKICLMRPFGSTLTIILALGTTLFAQEENKSSSEKKTYSQSYSSNSRNGSTVYNRSDGFQSFNIEMRGKIEVTDDDRDIKSMSPDGYLEINKTVFGSRRTLVITSQGGSLKREYYEGRSPVPYEPEGRKWLAEIMPDLVRSSLIAAESRVNRFFRQNGIQGVLNEIDQLESEYVQEHYAGLLVNLSGVTSKDYATIIDRVSKAINDSDYYLSEFLRKGLDKFVASKDAMEAVFRACESMDSDHYKTEIIKEALRTQPVSVESVKVILAATNKMESDHYKTEVLSTLLKQPNLGDPIISEMISATKQFESDHYRTVVLNKALASKGLSATSYQRTLESVKDFESDHYKTEVLTKLLSNKLPTEQVFALVDLTQSFDSDHYITIVFQAVLKNQDLNDEAFKALVNRAGSLDSDHYATEVLKSALEIPNLNDPKLISVINAAGNMESDHYITTVLTEAAPMVKGGSAAVKDAYRSTSKRISSETYYGRALKAID
jgi:hypothetical protein